MITFNCYKIKNPETLDLNRYLVKKTDLSIEKVKTSYLQVNNIYIHKKKQVYVLKTG